MLKPEQITIKMEAESRGGKRYFMAYTYGAIEGHENSKGKWRMYSEVMQLEEALRQSDEEVLQLKRQCELLKNDCDALERECIRLGKKTTDKKRIRNR